MSKSKKYKDRIEDLFSDGEHPQSEPTEGQQSFESGSALKEDSTALPTLTLDDFPPEAESRPREAGKVGWEEYLNAIDRDENLGFSFDQKNIQQLNINGHDAGRKGGSDQGIIEAPLQIGGSILGSLQLEGDTEWSEAEEQILATVAQQVTQHVDNLRLLEQAEHYRSEAEQATRQLTHEGWDSYLQSPSAPDRVFTYDQNRIISMDPDDPETFTDITSAMTVQRKNLKVREEDIGQIVIVDPNRDQKTVENLVSTIAERLSAHLENLRLLDETEHSRQQLNKRAAELESVAEVSTTTSAVLDLDQLLQNVVDLTCDRFGLYHAHIYMIDENWKSLQLAAGAGEVGRKMVAEGWSIELARAKSLVAQSVRTQGGIIVNNVSLEPDYSPNPLLPDTRSELAVPMIVGEQVLGVLDVQSNEIDHFSDEDIHIFTTLAAQVAVAVENALSFRRIQQAADEMTMLSNASQSLTGELRDVNDIAEKIIRYFHTAMSIPACVVSLYDPKENTVRTIADLDVDDGKVIMQGRVGEVYPCDGFPVTTRAIQTMQPFVVHVSDTEANPAEIAYLKEYELTTVVTLPMVVKGESIGIIELESYQEEIHLTQDEINLGMILSSQAGAAIENASLFEQTQSRAAELETVAQVGTAAATILDPQALLQSVVDLTSYSFNLYHASVYLLNETGDILQLAAASGKIGHAMMEEGRGIHIYQEKSIIAKAARRRETVIVGDTRDEPDFQHHQMLPEALSEMSVPLIVGEQLIGVFDVEADTIGRFTDADTRTYSTLASQTAVALRNAQLYAEQMETVERLRELDHLKSSFLANMSHELRTPLNSILGFAQVILEGLDGPLTEDMEMDLGLIEKNGQHLLNLINEVLDMAKIESGRISLGLEPVNLPEMLNDVVSTSSPLVRGDVELVNDCDLPDDMFIMADAVRLRQMLLNIIGNALKFTDQGSVKVETEQIDENLQIRVVDTGIGIPPDKLESIFEAFSQVDTSTTRKVGGTGLGLPISRRLAEMHGGWLWAKSRGVSGEGAIFYLDLPIGDVESLTIQ